MKKIDGYRYVLYKNAQHKSWSYILIRLLPIWIISFVLIVLALQSCKSVEHRPRYNHWAKPYKMNDLGYSDGASRSKSKPINPYKP